MIPVRFGVASALALAVMATTLLPACAELAQTPDVVRARYHGIAGKPIEDFPYHHRYYSWAPLSLEEIVIFTTQTDAYLLKFEHPCIDLPGTAGIQLTSLNTVTARIDSVLVQRHEEKGRLTRLECLIGEIRKVDPDGLRREIREHGPLKGAPPVIPATQPDAAKPGQAPLPAAKKSTST